MSDSDGYHKTYIIVGMELVNAHTHLELGWLAPYRPGVAGDTFTHWIIEVVGGAVRGAGDQRLAFSRQAIEDGIAALIACGITCVGDISATGLSIEPLLDSGLSGVVYIEVIGINAAMGQERLEFARNWINQWRKHERNGMRVGLSLHAPYSVAPPIWESALAYVRDENLPLCIHAAESDEEYDFFMNDRGPVADQNRRFGMDFPSPRMSPIQFLDEMGALALKPLLVHVVQVDDADIARIQSNGCSVVHCPRSNLRLRCGRMPLEKFLSAGVPVYMGTDSLGSSPSLCVQDEIEVAVGLHWGKVDPGVIQQLAHQSF